MTAFAVLAGRTLAGTRHPRNLVATAINTALFFGGYAIAFHGVLAGAGFDFGQFFPPAVVVQMTGLVAMASGFALATDRTAGFARRCRSLPIRAGAVVLARFAADATQAAMYLLCVLVLGFFFGFRFTNGSAAAVGFVLLTVAWGVALSVAVASFGLRARNPQTVGSTLFLVMFPLTFCSAVFVPVGAFPGWLQPVVGLSPFTQFAQALRELSTAGSTLSSVWWSLVWIVGLCTVGGWRAARALRSAS